MKRVGILGGGQLGAMLAESLLGLGARVRVFDPDPAAPAVGRVADRVVGAWDDRAALAGFADGCDVLTCDTEHVPLASLRGQPWAGLLRPSLGAIAIAQHRVREKAFLARAGLPHAAWRAARGPAEVCRAAEEFGYPLVVKSAEGGYDGRGQCLTRGPDELAAFVGPRGRDALWVIEEPVRLLAEFSCVVARSATGESVAFPLLENAHRNHILDATVLPARVAPAVARHAEEMARAAAQALDVHGLLTVEFFLGLRRDGARVPQLLVNELAPRPHNSGHVTRRACTLSEKVCRAAIQLVPHDANSHYNLACALARQGKTEDALASLERAIELGFRGADHLKADDDLASLREEDRFKKAVEAAAQDPPEKQGGWQYQVEPAAIVDGVATVDSVNTAWDPRRGVFVSLFKLDTAPPAETPIAKGYGEAGDLLNAWQAEGTAAGNRGDLYDNHDSDHSNMGYGMFPQLTRIEFAEVPKSRRLHHGLQVRFLFNGVTIGNSSTAITSGPFWRSQARLAMSDPRAVALLYQQYVSHHLYMYPEHRDYDPGPAAGDGKGFGDVFAVNTPYLIISQGSSGSDRVFLDAVAATLAAFRPEVKQELVRTGALMPTVQMVFRSSNKQVPQPEDYLTGKAHPTVFEGNQLDPVKMVRTAHEITKDTLPPVVQLKVVEEDQPVAGRDFFTAGSGERLFDTPCAIARIARSTQYSRRMVISAEASKDLNDRPLTYHWSVLRGDAERIKINPLNDAGSVVELLIPYHERSPISPGSEMQSSRVDIGAFVHNGTYYSAPGFVSVYYLDNEKRQYDDQGKVLVVDYADPEVSKNYVDPAVDAPKQWRDEYHYGESGELTGWTRVRGDAQEQFTADGLLIDKTDAEGRPLEARRVRYEAKPRDNRPPMVEQVTTDEVVSLTP